ncbi:helix-turn-helix transcriptional regulator [Halosolutus gelatinilyticus]|uniref:helix-turn-helix transcriptional regulator n=1 Tax=Halosolutus gelatinilyticus TaxID=2931975 RepID=UPI001FF5DF11|nr:LuxR C-terminal-related transcriptional regulator [Halosolutus gelatinilyticus]
MEERSLAASSTIPDDLTEQAADDHDIDGYMLATELITIDDDLVENADAIDGDYESELEIDPIIAAVGHFTAIYVFPEQWDTIQDRHDLADSVKHAAMQAHKEYARRMGANEQYLKRYEALVLPSPVVTEFVDAGLSRRQAEVQALRIHGSTHETISDELRMSVGTVKSHCHRIDEKIRQAEKLVRLTAD